MVNSTLSNYKIDDRTTCVEGNNTKPENPEAVDESDGGLRWRPLAAGDLRVLPQASSPMHRPVQRYRTARSGGPRVRGPERSAREGAGSRRVSDNFGAFVAYANVALRPSEDDEVSPGRTRRTSDTRETRGSAYSDSAREATRMYVNIIYYPRGEVV
jgi:hypothetical protein